MLGARIRGKSNFTFGKSQRVLRRSLRAKALGFVRSALLHYQNFVSGVALAQDDVLRGRLRWAKISAPRRMLAFVEPAPNTCIRGTRASREVMPSA